MKTTKLLTGVLVLQGLILIGQWTGGGSYLAPAQAQLPDPANRQMQMVDELKNLNSKMDQMIALLKDGEVQVKVTNPDEKKAAAPAPAK